MGMRVIAIDGGDEKRDLCKWLGVEAYIDLNNNSIVGITALSNVQTSNNVTGSPLNGQAFNRSFRHFHPICLFLIVL